MVLRICIGMMLWFILFSCSKNGITLPPLNPHSNLENTVPVADTVARKMEGIFVLSAGNGSLGSQFVCKVSKKKLSFFSNQSGIFMILNYGLNPADSSLQFSGFWRYSENATQGNIQFSIAWNEGLSDLLKNGVVSSNLSFRGSFVDGHGSSQPISLNYKSPFSQYTRTHDFAIFAHHGVQTTANPPYAQNSLNGVLNDEDYGVNGLEFDVRLTKDHVPICIHDATIDPRLTLKSPLFGEYIQYSFPFLQQYVKLIDGQKIPSVEEVLRAFVDSTNMKYMWLDVKGDPNIFVYLEPIVQEAYARAAAKNRNVEIFADLPSTTTIDYYKETLPVYSTLPKMCEQTLDAVIENHAEYYGPRFSEGLLLDEVEKAHSMGIKVYSWTLNDKNIILNYLQNGKFDGFISDYPAYVVYDYYTMF